MKDQNENSIYTEGKRPLPDFSCQRLFCSKLKHFRCIRITVHAALVWGEKECVKCNIHVNGIPADARQKYRKTGLP